MRRGSPKLRARATRVLLGALVVCMCPASLARAQDPFGEKPGTAPLPFIYPKAATLPPPLEAGPVVEIYAPSLPCDDARPLGTDFWAQVDYLLYRVRDARTPPLLTTSSQSSMGVLGAPDTRVLYGGDAGQELRHGGRLAVGAWLDDLHKVGVEADAFFLGRRSSVASFASSGDPLLTRPFLDVSDPNNPFQNSQVVANLPDPTNPNLSPLAGKIQFHADSELWGIEGNFVGNLGGCGSRRVDFLTGVRHLQLREGLTIQEVVQVPPNDLGFVEEISRVVDHFGTGNYFYGGQVGLRCRWDRGRATVQTTAKLALGCNRQRINIHGQTETMTPPGAAQTFSAGVLALSSNSGEHERSVFAVVPEVNVQVSWKVTEQVSVSAGYSFLYWSNVARPGDQIDTSINQALLPGINLPGGPARPAVRFQNSDFWAQGLNVGIAIRY